MWTSVLSLASATTSSRAHARWEDRSTSTLNLTAALWCRVKTMRSRSLPPPRCLLAFVACFFAAENDGHCPQTGASWLPYPVLLLLIRLFCVSSLSHASKTWKTSAAAGTNNQTPQQQKAAMVSWASSNTFSRSCTHAYLNLPCVQ